ncbi:HNH endonuclease signature motif containing protein [Pedococcus sp. 2YAF34]|uniref:HNH endonuclease signature motif containing protein n=1 Tax=Pedococcus sp. 2YAF34 TaxID=3233032 RepID=UPI003F980E6C
MSTAPLAQSRHRRQQELWARTAAVAGRLNRAQAELVDIAAELITDRHWGDGGFKTPEHYLVVRAGLSPAHAKDVVAVARRRAELVEASSALGAGELSLDQVAVIAHGVPAGYQASVTALAREATVPQLRRAVSRHAFPAAAAAVAEEAGGGAAAEAAESSPDDSTEDSGVDPRVEVERAEEAARRSVVEQRACAKPELSMSYDADGRFQLRYSAPATIGALVEQAVKEAKDALFTRRRDDAAVTRVEERHAGLPTYADALEEMANRSLATVESTSRAAHYRVYLHLDTEGAWVTGGHAIPLRLLGRFISDGVVQPVWETDGTPVSVGRAMRILPERTRHLIIDRDRGCRFPGCTSTGFTEVHHLHAWADGGTTDLHNQISLCTAHHDGIDRGDHTITGDPTGPDGLVVTNRHGLTIRPPRPADTAPPPGGDPQPPPGTYQPPSGGPVHWNDVELPPDHELPSRHRKFQVVPAAPTEPEPEFVSWLDDPANPDRGLIRVL